MKREGSVYVAESLLQPRNFWLEEEGKLFFPDCLRRE